MNSRTRTLIMLIVTTLLLEACAPGAPTAGTATPSTLAPTTGPTAVLTAAATGAPTTSPTVAATSLPTTSPTSAPTTPATAAPTVAATTTGAAAALRIAVQAPDKSVHIVDQSGKSTVLSKTGVQFQVGRPWYAIGNSVYAASQDGKTYVIDATGARQLTFIPNISYGLAANGSGTAQLAWGTATFGQNTIAAIDVSAPAGTGKKTLAKETFAGEPRVYRVEKYSRDGKLIYFGKEPTGLGGYILFGGLTSLWTADAATGKTTVLISEKASGGIICIDAIAPNEQLAATHCNRKGISVVSLTNASSAAQIITPPANIDFQQIGSATFSPDSARVAFAVARGNPDDEQGWVLVSDGLSGAAKMIAQSAAKDWYTVVAWPDPNAILLQSNSVSPTPNTAVYMARPDGSGVTKLADGTFLAVLSGTR